MSKRSPASKRLFLTQAGLAGAAPKKSGMTPIVRRKVTNPVIASSTMLPTADRKPSPGN